MRKRDVKLNFKQQILKNGIFLFVTKKVVLQDLLKIMYGYGYWYVFESLFLMNASQFNNNFNFHDILLLSRIRIFNLWCF